MSRPGTFERVYAAIKERLREGGLRPGDRLEPALLSDDLNSSVTPVRDALHRLVGERLVEAPRHEGFRVPMLTETMLRHLYGWHLDLLLLALARRRTEPIEQRSAADAPAADRRLSATFAAIAADTGNPEHAAVLDNLAQRLEPYERLERLFLDGVEDEIAEVIAAVDGQDLKQLRRALVRYHRRRQRIVPELLATISRTSPEPLRG